jgi:2-dehydro-3-deoxygluconokinase
VNYGFEIRSGGALDFLALGALVHRLDPGVVPFRKATRFDVHVSGGEFNCAANLADCFGLQTGIATAMVDYPIGDLISAQVRAMGVKPFYKRFPHNGVNGPNMAAVYSDRGYGVRAPSVFYNRANEAAARLKPGDFDWSAIFGAGVRWFHSGGIFAALSGTTGPLILEAIHQARAHGAVVSFDLNYRERLWKARGEEARAIDLMSRIAEHIDVLLGNEEDLQLALGISGLGIHPDQPMNPEALLAMFGSVTRRYPNIKAVASTLRQVHSTNRASFSAAAWIDGQTYQAPVCELDVFDRVGRGDGFAAGLFFGLLTGAAPEEAVCLGWAHGALLTTFPGDTTMATLDQVRALAAGGSGRIQR